MSRFGVTLLVCLCLVPAAVRAQGFGVYEQSACAMGRGNTGVAEPCGDGSAIYVNPAALATGGNTLGAGVIPIFGSGTFTSDAGKTTSLTALKTPPFHA